MPRLGVSSNRRLRIEPLLMFRLFQVPPLLIGKMSRHLLALLLLLLTLLLLLLFHHLAAERLNLPLVTGLLFLQAVHLFLLLCRGLLRHSFGRFDDSGIKLPPQLGFRRLHLLTHLLQPRLLDLNESLG